MKEDARNMNDLPDRFELFTLEEGEEKVTVQYDPHIPNTATFTFAREDHTLGNLLASALLATDNVLFAAYKVPHPLFPSFVLRVSTTEDTGPRQALEDACRRVIHDLQNMGKQFTREWEIWKLTNEAAAGRENLERDQRERKMEEARKVRDKIRNEMLRDSHHMFWGGASESRGEGSGVGGTGGGEGSEDGYVSPPWDGGESFLGGEALGGGDQDGDASPPWDGGNNRNSGKASGRAPWENPEPTVPGSPPWDGSSSVAPTGGRAPWEEAVGRIIENSTSSAPRDDPPYSSGREPTATGLSSSRIQSNRNEQSPTSILRAPWDAPVGPIIENGVSRAPWDDPPSGSREIRPTFEQPNPRNQFSRTAHSPAPTSRAPWEEPAGLITGNSANSAPWDAPYSSSERSATFDRSRNQSRPNGQPSGSVSRTTWNGSDASYNPGRGSPTYEPVYEAPISRVQTYQQPSPAPHWGTQRGGTQNSRPWNEPPTNTAATTATTTAYAGGRSLTLEQRSASPTVDAPWNQSAGRTHNRASWNPASSSGSAPWNEQPAGNIDGAQGHYSPAASPPRDPDSSGERAYLSRPPAVIAARAPARVPNIYGQQARSNRAPWEQENAGSGNASWDGSGGNAGSDDEATSPQWSGNGGDTPDPAANAGKKAPWENY